MRKYWLSVPLIGIALILVACSESPTSSGGVVMSKGEGGGQITINVEQTGGVGAIQVYSVADSHLGRIAVAEGQCTGPDSCNDSIQVPYASTADGIRVVWSAGHLPGKQYYMSTAHTCSPGNTGCNGHRTAYMYKMNADKTQVEATFQVDPTNDSITIGGSFSVGQPDSAGGVNYCYAGGDEGDDPLKEGEVIGNAACQAAVNEWVALWGLSSNSEAPGVLYSDIYDGEETPCGIPLDGDVCAGDGEL